MIRLSNFLSKLITPTNSQLTANFKTRISYSTDSSSSTDFENSSPARAVLYVPGNDSKKLAKVFSFNSDIVVFDCEDGVALNRKEEARNNIRNLYHTDKKIQTDPERKYAVRINPAPTDLALQDINTIFTLKSDLSLDKKSKPVTVSDFFPKCLFVPKINYAEDIKWLYEKLEAKLKGYSHKLNLFFYMESAMSLINLNKIIQTALAESSLKYSNRFKLEGFVFGSDDFCADISIVRTKDASELSYARQKLVTHCKAYKLKAIDMVYIDFKGKYLRHVLANCLGN